ncbi:hypothetical protein C8Q76DRAFT_68382 [Earliella scabrosa]|nr:hypothetical protein C8Q76DRAFT_68382 [Earliella scabrosa]
MFVQLFRRCQIRRLNVLRQPFALALECYQPCALGKRRGRRDVAAHRTGQGARQSQDDKGRVIGPLRANGHLLPATQMQPQADADRWTRCCCRRREALRAYMRRRDALSSVRVLVLFSERCSDGRNRKLLIWDNSEVSLLVSSLHP